MSLGSVEMPLIPYKRVILSTTLSTEKATSVLAGHLVRPELRDPRRFTGEPYENGFRVWRNAWSRPSITHRSVVPISYVRLREGRHGTLVDTVITFYPVQTVILLLIVCFGASEIYGYFKVLISKGVIDSGLVSTLSLFLIIYSLLILFFNHEADLAERFLCGIYHGHRIEG